MKDIGIEVFHQRKLQLPERKVKDTRKVVYSSQNYNRESVTPLKDSDDSRPSIASRNFDPEIENESVNPLPFASVNSQQKLNCDQEGSDFEGG